MTRQRRRSCVCSTSDRVDKKRSTLLIPTSPPSPSHTSTLSLQHHTTPHTNSAFLDAHPGGATRIMMTNGSDLSAFWKVYNLHNRPHVRQLLEEYRIGYVVLYGGVCVRGAGGGGHVSLCVCVWGCLYCGHNQLIVSSSSAFASTGPSPPPTPPRSRSRASSGTTTRLTRSGRAPARASCAFPRHTRGTRSRSSTSSPSLASTPPTTSSLSATTTRYAMCRCR